MRFFLFFGLICLLVCPLAGRSQSQWVDSTLNAMSLEEKIGQLIMIAAYSNKDSLYEKQLGATIEKYHIGGIIFFQGTPSKQAAMTNDYQQRAYIPLMIGMDAESGVGWRIKPAMEFPNQTLLGAIRDTNLIYRIGQAIGRQCRTMGIHVNFAPVADINVNPKNPVIGIRSFGEKKDEVGNRSLQYTRGLESQQIMPVAKHFPGHGDTDTDSHFALPLIRHSVARIDTVELYPFRQLIAAGIPGVMVAHLNVPSYDSANIPASLSHHIVTQLLREKMHFDGLCFTDAMNMKGVTKGNSPGEADVKALSAGNDILLFPENVEATVKKVKAAIRKGILTEEDIDEKCRRVLAAKEKYVLPNAGMIDTTMLSARLNTPADQALLQETYAEAITLIQNKDLLLPLTHLDTLRIASLNFGDRKAKAFEDMLEKYAPCSHFSIRAGASKEAIEKLLKDLSDYNCVIVYNSAARNTTSRQFGASQALSNILKQLKGKRVIFCHPATPYGLDIYSYLPLDAILVSYSHDTPAQEFVAQAIFGGINVNGKLPVSINYYFPVGSGLSTPKVRLGYHKPETSGMQSETLLRIDSICQVAIREKATPGCQVLVAKDGYVVYNKAFGFNTYDKKKANTTDNIYDIASITKIAATLPAVMMLYDQQTIALDTPIARYSYTISQSNKKDLTVRELLLHNAGLKASFSFFHHAIDWEKMQGRLFTTRYTKTNTKKLRDRLYINPNFRYRDSTFSFKGGEDYLMVSPHFYMHRHFQDSIHSLILNTDLLPQKKYTHSDLGFVLLKDIVEEQTVTPFDMYLRDHFLKKLGAYNSGFNAHLNLDMDRVIPSSNDNVFRKSELKGYVHDPLAALMGGVSGNAGLFSTAEDLAKIMSVYLNHGQYGGERMIDSTTIDLFTSIQLSPEQNRRGLGFDKPETLPDRTSPTCDGVPCTSYGHTGFTGAIAWNDPENQLIYIFLSNRTYPNEFNTKLMKENIRTKIQEIIYESIGR